MKPMGIVAKSAHQIGRYKSAAMPKTTKLAQKAFFSIASFYRPDRSPCGEHLFFGESVTEGGANRPTGTWPTG